MLQRKWGRIINISSVIGKVGAASGAAYSASKHGLLGLTRTLALEVARDGITVNAICPGPVRTVMSDRRMRYDAERLGISFEELESRVTPIGRRLEPRKSVHSPSCSPSENPPQLQARRTTSAAASYVGDDHARGINSIDKRERIPYISVNTGSRIQTDLLLKKGVL